MNEKFSEGVASWQAKLGLTRDVVRQELVSRQLLEHMPHPSLNVRVLDIGSGQGTQAIRLADLGYSVLGVEPSSELLEQAERSSRNSANPARFLKGTLENFPAEAGTGFDIVCCHGVLMYLAALEPAIAQLTALARPGGIVSLLTRNRPSIAMRAGMQKNWKEAIQDFDARYYKNRLGISDVRADDPDEVIESLQRNQAEVIAWYGVRLFTDHWEDQPPPEDLDQLVEVEYQAGRREPYRRLASLTHVLAKKLER